MRQRYNLIWGYCAHVQTDSTLRAGKAYNTFNIYRNVVMYKKVDHRHYTQVKRANRTYDVQDEGEVKTSSTAVSK